MFRFISKNDFIEWSSLIQELWPMSNEEVESCFLEAITSEKEVTIGYFDSGLIGMVMVSLRTDYVAGTESSPVGYIEGIVVKELRRKEGIASKLIDEAIKYVKSLGCTEIGSDVEIENELSIMVHKRLGFIEQERVVCFSKKI